MAIVCVDVNDLQSLHGKNRNYAYIFIFNSINLNDTYAITLSDWI